MNKSKHNLSNVIEVPIVEEAVEESSSNLDSKGRAYSSGRRKEASARLWLSLGNKFYISKSTLNDYFKNEALVNYIMEPAKLVGMERVNVSSTVSGGGKTAQAGALRLALAKALSLFDSSFRPALKAAGMLTSDSRRKEREHYGYRRSRVPQQYSRR